MTPSARFENCIKYCLLTIEQPIAKRVEVGPVVTRAMRAEQLIHARKYIDCDERERSTSAYVRLVRVRTIYGVETRIMD